MSYRLRPDVFKLTAFLAAFLVVIASSLTLYLERGSNILAQDEQCTIGTEKPYEEVGDEFKSEEVEWFDLETFDCNGEVVDAWVEIKAGNETYTVTQEELHPCYFFYWDQDGYEVGENWEGEDKGPECEDIAHYDVYWECDCPEECEEGYVYNPDVEECVLEEGPTPTPEGEAQEEPSPTPTEEPTPTPTPTLTPTPTATEIPTPTPTPQPQVGGAQTSSSSNDTGSGTSSGGTPQGQVLGAATLGATGENGINDFLFVYGFILSGVSLLGLALYGYK